MDVVRGRLDPTLHMSDVMGSGALLDVFEGQDHPSGGRGLRPSKREGERRGQSEMSRELRGIWGTKALAVVFSSGGDLKLGRDFESRTRFVNPFPIHVNGEFSIW